MEVRYQSKLAHFFLLLLPVSRNTEYPSPPGTVITHYMTSYFWRVVVLGQAGLYVALTSIPGEMILLSAVIIFAPSHVEDISKSTVFSVQSMSPVNYQNTQAQRHYLCSNFSWHVKQHLKTSCFSFNFLLHLFSLLSSLVALVSNGVFLTWYLKSFTVKTMICSHHIHYVGSKFTM